MAAISETLRQDFKDGDFAETYVESFLDTYVATQIKVLREQQEMTQKQLAEKLGTKQTVVSRIENINYSAWNIGTLKKIARALGLRLHVSFEEYGSFLDEIGRFSRKTLERRRREKDPAIFGGNEDERSQAKHEPPRCFQADSASSGGDTRTNSTGKDASLFDIKPQMAKAKLESRTTADDKTVALVGAQNGR